MRVYVNNKETLIEDNSKLSTLLKKDQIGIINGFSEIGTVTIKPDDRIIIIDKNTYPDKNTLELMLTSRHTIEVIEKLKNSKVAIIGLGGLGSNVAIHLARMHVSKLLLVDFDKVDVSNINRQAYFINDLNKYKTTALKNHLKKINPFIEIKTKRTKANRDNILNIVKDYDFIVEALDIASTKAEIINEILEKTDKIVIAGSGVAGFESSNSIKTERKMKRLYICGDQKTEVGQNVSLVSSRVAIVAAHQANMVLRLILGIEEV